MIEIEPKQNLDQKQWGNDSAGLGVVTIVYSAPERLAIKLDCRTLAVDDAP